MWSLPHFPIFFSFNPIEHPQFVIKKVVYFETFEIHDSGE